MAAGINLRVIGTSDLHTNIFPYDYYRDRPDSTVGLSVTATLIAAARAETVNTVLLDNGDVIQGTPLGDYYANAWQNDHDTIHPMIAAMNELDYVAGTLGNHEFNYGLDLLDNVVRSANFPIVNCNVLKPDGDFYFKPWIIIERSLTDETGVAQTLKLGIVGFVTPQIVQWDKSHVSGRAVTVGIVEAARKHVANLRQLGADLVIALCHSGISRKRAMPGDEDAALALAQVGGIDAILTGHQHLLLPGTDFEGIDGVDAARGALNGIPAFMPGFWGSHLGVIDLYLTKSEMGWRVAKSSVSARPIYTRNGDSIQPTVQPDPRLLAVARSAHEATLAYVRSPVGEIVSPINSYFALVADDPSVQIVNSAQMWYTKRLAETIPELAGLPILSAAAPFKCGGRGGPDYYTDVAAGPVAIKNVADLYVYPNGLRVVKISGATVLEWLERSVSLFLRIDPKSPDPQALLDSTFAGYNFDVIDGVSYAVDVTQPARYDTYGQLVHSDSRRVIDLKFNGAPIDLDQEFLVVTNSYRAGGGGNFPGCDGSTVVFEAPDSNRDVLVRYIVETRHVEPKSDGNWRFQPWPAEAMVTFLTSPAAATAPPPSGISVSSLGSAAGGFAMYGIQPK